MWKKSLLGGRPGRADVAAAQALAENAVGGEEGGGRQLGGGGLLEADPLLGGEEALPGAVGGLGPPSLEEEAARGEPDEAGGESGHESTTHSG